MEVGLMLGVTRGRVENENNSQSQYLNISNNTQIGVYIYKSESIAIRNGKISEYGLEQECDVRTQNRNRNKDRNRNWNWD